MGHHLKGHHGKNKRKWRLLTKLLWRRLSGRRKKLYDNREKIKELLSDDKEKATTLKTNKGLD